MPMNPFDMDRSPRNYFRSGRLKKKTRRPMSNVLAPTDAGVPSFSPRSTASTSTAPVSPFGNPMASGPKSSARPMSSLLQSNARPAAAATGGPPIRGLDIFSRWSRPPTRPSTTPSTRPNTLPPGGGGPDKDLPTGPPPTTPPAPGNEWVWDPDLGEYVERPISGWQPDDPPPPPKPRHPDYNPMADPTRPPHYLPAPGYKWVWDAATPGWIQVKDTGSSDDDDGDDDRTPYKVGQAHKDNPNWIYRGHGIWYDTKSGALRHSDEYGSPSDYDPSKDKSDWRYMGRDKNTGQSRWYNKKLDRYHVGPRDPDEREGGKASDWERVGNDPRTGLPLWKHVRSSTLRMGHINPANRDYDWDTILGLNPQETTPTPPTTPTTPWSGFEDYQTGLLYKLGQGLDTAQGLSETGGVTDAFRRAVRGRAGDTVSGITSALTRNLRQQKSISQGGASFNDVMSRIQDQGARTASDTSRDAEIGLGEYGRSGQLAGLQALFGGGSAISQQLLGMESQKLGWAGLAGQQETQRSLAQSSFINSIANLFSNNQGLESGTWDQIQQILAGLGGASPGLLELFKIIFGQGGR